MLPIGSLVISNTMTTQDKKWLAIGGLILLLICFCLMPEEIIGDFGTLVTFVFGWILFLKRVVPQIHVQWGSLIVALVYASLLITGAQWFLKWLYREMRAPAAPPAWRLRWTFSGALIILLMFLAGMAAIGVAHQTAWLVNSPEPIFKQHFVREGANRVKCRSNLKRIAQSLSLYAADHAGKYPPDLSMLLDEDMPSAVFVCPSSNDEPATGPTTQAIATDLATPNHCSYIYLGKGLSRTANANQVFLLEPLENHQHKGLNVLFGDGRVEWLNKPEAEVLLKKLGLSGSTTQKAGTK